MRFLKFSASTLLAAVFLFGAGKTSAQTSADASHPLDALAGNPNLWQMTKQDFAQQTQALGFRWLSNAQDAARSGSRGVTLFQIPVYETVARFDGDKLKELTVSIYNRGDAGNLGKEQFEALLKKSVDGISAATKAQPVVRGKDSASAVKAYGLDWPTPATDFLLEYSFSKENKAAGVPYRGEFIRLSMHSNEKPKNFVAAAIAERDKSKFVGLAHVKKDASGDVHLEGVPMVDQGQKGYCVVASAERVIRYYGGKADEHELAEIANSSAAGGTSVTAMMESLKKLSNRLRVKVRTVEPFGVPQIEKLVGEYNRLAKRGKRAQEIQLGHMIDVHAIYTTMDTDVLREARTKNASELNRFQREVQAHVDQGIPLLWSVMLGKVSEPGIPQNAGGHMRLIIGYNTKSSEILYSDSWGPGHELKRMPAADAWTITTGVNTIEPLGS
jgi:peptidase C39-like protein